MDIMTGFEFDNEIAKELRKLKICHVALFQITAKNAI